MALCRRGTRGHPPWLPQAFVESDLVSDTLVSGSEVPAQHGVIVVVEAMTTAAGRAARPGSPPLARLLR